MLTFARKLFASNYERSETEENSFRKRRIWTSSRAKVEFRISGKNEDCDWLSYSKRPKKKC